MIVETENKEGSPLVSIFCATYNHEKYIEQAIDGFLMQKTDFPFEIIITEDKSTDGTSQIIRKYENNFAEKFVVFYHKENLYSQKIDFFQTEVLPVIKGKYIAWCEGDDYWTDPYKLQKQVDFLELNKDSALVFTDVDILYNYSGKIIKSFDITRRKKIPQGNVFKSLIYSNPYKTCTAIFRKSAIDNYYDFINKEQFMMGDYGLWLYISKRHKVGYIKESTAVYRILHNSASHFNTYKEFRAYIHSGNQLRRHTATKFNFKISATKVFLWNLRVLLAYIIKKKDYKSYINYLFKRDKLGINS